MAKQKTVIIGITVFVLLIIVAFALSNFSNVKRTQVTNPERVNLKDVNCDVTVKNPRGIPIVKGGDMVIEAADCQQQFVSNCGRFGIFSDKGTLRLEAQGGLGSATDIKISEGSSEVFSLNWCGSKLTSDFDIKLFDEENSLLYTKKVILR